MPDDDHSSAAPVYTRLVRSNCERISVLQNLVRIKDVVTVLQVAAARIHIWPLPRSQNKIVLEKSPRLLEQFTQREEFNDQEE